MKYHIVLLSLLFSLTVAVCAQSISDLEKQRKETLAKIAQTDQELKQTQSTARGVLKKVTLLNQQISTRQQWISTLNREMNRMESQIYTLNQELNSLQRDLENKKSQYAKSLQAMYKRNQGEEKLLFVFSAKSLSQSYRRLRYLNEYASWQQKQAKEIVAKQELLEQKKAELAEAKVGKEKVKKESEQEKLQLVKTQKAEKGVAGELKKKEKELNALLSKHKKQAAALNRRIEQIIEEEARRSKAEAAAQTSSSSSGSKRTSTKSSGGYSMTSEERELSDSFEKNRGRLPFPLRGRYEIVGEFGTHQYKGMKYVQTNSSGIDIKTDPGTDARAVFNGMVSKVFVVPGYNTSVILRHGNYLTVYSNLSSVYVKAGDRVSTSQAIGKIFSDSQDDGATILHFQLWKETSKVDPLPWLNR